VGSLLMLAPYWVVAKPSGTTFVAALGRTNMDQAGYGYFG